MDKLLLGILNEHDILKKNDYITSSWSNNIILNILYMLLLICVMIGIIRSLLSLGHKVIVLIGEISWLILEICILIIMLSPLHVGCNLITMFINKILIPCMKFVERKTVRVNNPLYNLKGIFSKNNPPERIIHENVHEI
ncbi:TPA_asm: P6 [Betula betacytorhabdovirus 2]|nr:TPA_asm: P6 [Betula betacytorhabdovirus 2]